ncbi:MAG: hypothetical protein KDD05_01885 [Psychroserpens sp.]|nr:hypothetical protein [Psychroserpens sp.]
MKVIYFHNLLLVFFGLIVNTICAQVDTLYIDSSFTELNLSKIGNRYSSKSAIPIDDAYKNSLKFKSANKHFAFYNIDEDFGFFSFSVTNSNTKEQHLIIEVYNALLNEIRFYEKQHDAFVLINEAGTDFPFHNRLKNDRNFVYPVTLNSGESKSFIFEFKKNKISIVVPVKIATADVFQNQNKLQYWCIGIYYGLCIISIIIGLYVFFLLKKYLYLLYAGYIVSLGLYLFSYLGLFFQFFYSNQAFYNKYIHVFFAVSSVVLFILFSVKVLNAKRIAPKLTTFLIGFLMVTIVIRFGELYLSKSIFAIVKTFIIKFWYLSFFIMNFILILLTLKSYKHQKKITAFYSIAYSFVGVATIITIVNLSTGKVNAFFYGLPIIFYASFLEIIFLTFTIIFMVKEIYDERNSLSEKIVIEEKKNLTAFIKGEDQERRRISNELHDNIGSQLSYLKRVVADNYKNTAINETIDAICNDVRNLSHEISPSDLKLVGFENAISDLANNLSSQTSLMVGFSSYNFPNKLDENIETQLYRVIQEALTNILRHADAKHIELQLIGHRTYATITIEDDGKGFNPNTQESGLGLKNMNSRIKQIGGQLEIDSKINKGTSLIITIPFKEST